MATDITSDGACGTCRKCADGFSCSITFFGFFGFSCCLFFSFFLGFSLRFGFGCPIAILIVAILHLGWDYPLPAVNALPVVLVKPVLVLVIVCPLRLSIVAR